MELTKRQFKTGVYEHILDINKRNNFPSVISNYWLIVSETHEFDWKHVQVLNNKPSTIKRLIFEMMYNILKIMYNIWCIIY